MSKITNWIVENFGTDKVLHFLVGAWITALSALFGWTGIIPAFIIVFALSYIKEEWLDEVFDSDDIFAAMMGCVASVLLYGCIRLIL